MELVLNLKLDKVCRLCLMEKDELTCLFSHNLSDVCQHIYIFTNINVVLNDGLSSKICENCLSTIEKCYEFRMMCQESDKHVRKLLNREYDIKEEVDDTLPPFNVVDVVIKEDVEDAESTQNKYEISIRESEVDLEDKTNIDLKIDVSGSESNNMLQRSGKRCYYRRKPLKIHRCEICDTAYTFKKCLDRHNLRKHGIKASPKPQPVCKVCNAEFRYWNELFDHEKFTGHQAKEDCPYCRKSYARSYLPQHISDHTKELTYLCNVCGKEYTNQNSFHRHTKLCLSIDKNLKCSTCEKKFHTKSRLDEHARMHSDKRPFVCETCGIGFRRGTNLRNHRMMHSDTRPFDCDVCKKKFRTKALLNQHMVVHTGVRPYACDICEAAFTQRHCLKSHKLKHQDP